ncbi:zinc ABC transporter substrate-binding protein, partial [Pseudomonas syringae]|nr:zinc ABC transporter substrate-binding protein [Pseudomonas syringae]
MKLLPVSLAVAALLSSPLAMAKTVNAVASFSILGDIVQEVGGEHVKVTTLVGPDGDPHSFEPSPKDSKAINASDVVFVSGLGLEGWIDRLVTASGYKGHLVTASEGVNSRKMEEDGKQITDRHAWNSMANGVIYATNVMNALIKVDPEDADYFRQRGTAYIEQLQKL